MRNDAESPAEEAAATLPRLLPFAAAAANCDVESGAMLLRKIEDEEAAKVGPARARVVGVVGTFREERK